MKENIKITCTFITIWFVMGLIGYFSTNTANKKIEQLGTTHDTIIYDLKRAL